MGCAASFFFQHSRSIFPSVGSHTQNGKPGAFRTTYQRLSFMNSLVCCLLVIYFCLFFELHYLTPSSCCVSHLCRHYRPLMLDKQQTAKSQKRKRARQASGRYHFKRSSICFGGVCVAVGCCSPSVVCVCQTCTYHAYTVEWPADV